LATRGISRWPMLWPKPCDACWSARIDLNLVPLDLRPAPHRQGVAHHAPTRLDTVLHGRFVPRSHRPGTLLCDKLAGVCTDRQLARQAGPTRQLRVQKPRALGLPDTIPLHPQSRLHADCAVKVDGAPMRVRAWPLAKVGVAVRAEAILWRRNLTLDSEGQVCRRSPSLG
jgi:hypothetical protein